MAGKNDFTATAGIDLDTWSKDIAKMVLETLRVEKSADKAAEKQEKAAKAAEKRAAKEAAAAEKAAKAEEEKAERAAKAAEKAEQKEKLSKAARIATTTAFGAQVVGELTGVNVAVGDTSKAFKDLKTNAFGDAAPEGLDRAANAFKDVGNAADGIVKKIPFVGEALSDLANVTRKYSEDELRVVVATGKEAESADALANKLRELRDARTTEQSKTIRNEESLRRLGDEIDRTAEKYERAAKRELDAGKENSAGQMQRISLAQLETEKKQKLADLSESLKNQLGEKGQAGAKMFDVGAQKIEREFQLRRRNVEMSETQEKVATNLNEIAKTISIEYADQLELQREKIAANEIEVKKASELYGEHSLIASQLKAQRRDLIVHAQEMEYMHAAAIIQAEDATKALDAQIAGNKTLAAIEQNRVAHAQAIRDAIRQGNPEIAQQLAQQQALNNLDARARQLRRTPKQVQDERKEQEAQDRAIRHINAIENNNPNQIAADGRNRVSPAAARARAEYAARHAPANIAAAQKQMEVQTVKAGTIIVQQLKSN